MPYHIVKQVDAKGLQCPMPLLKAKQALNLVEVGQVIEVLATDAGSFRDFRVFSEQSVHELLLAQESGGDFIYHLRKGAVQFKQIE